jgi:hypothetical protein
MHDTAKEDIRPGRYPGPWPRASASFARSETQASSLPSARKPIMHGTLLAANANVPVSIRDVLDVDGDTAVSKFSVRFYCMPQRQN